MSYYGAHARVVLSILVLAAWCHAPTACGSGVGTFELESRDARPKPETDDHDDSDANGNGEDQGTIVPIAPPQTGGTDGAVTEPWRFIVYGDTRGNDDGHRRVLRSIVENTPGYEFILHAGDVVSDGDDDDDWGTWDDAVHEVLGGIGQEDELPRYMAAPGNHDDLDNSDGRTNWKRYLPGQQKFGNGGAFFAFDHENARFLVLDSEESDLDGAQYSLLKTSIEGNPKTWLFTVWHSPIFTFGSKNYERGLHSKWGTKLYVGGCDVMFMGHAHHYVRTVKLALNGNREPAEDQDAGTVQIITGTGGVGTREVDPDGNAYMVAGHSALRGYTELTVDEATLRLRQISADGQVLDEAHYAPNPKLTDGPS